MNCNHRSPRSGFGRHHQGCPAAGSLTSAGLQRYELPGYHPVTDPHGKQIQAAAEIIAQSKKPIFYVGGGIVRSGAAAELLN
jgi:thiamine pyrophosphate-dependent acetolactate synthase large subunit-like protein